MVFTTVSLVDPLSLTSTERQAKQCTRRPRERSSYIFFLTRRWQCVFAICTLLKSLLAEFALNKHQLLHRLLLSSTFCNMLPCPHWIRPSPPPPWCSLALVQHRTSGAVQPWCSPTQCRTTPPPWCSVTPVHQPGGAALLIATRSPSPAPA